MGKVLLTIGIIIAILFLFIILVYNFWTSRIISILLCIANILMVKNSTDLIGDSFQIALILGIAVVFFYGRYNMNPVESRYIKVYSDGTETREISGGIFASIFAVPFVFEIIYWLIVPRVNFLWYGLPILFLVFNVFTIILKITTGEEIMEPDSPGSK